jgi:cytochrome b subunit of formate dehydrogenase
MRRNFESTYNFGSLMSGKRTLRTWCASAMLLASFALVCAHAAAPGQDPSSRRALSLEEKFEYIGVFWGTFVLGATGLLMWFNAWTTRYLPGRILTIATLIHTFEAFLALLHVGIVHMVSVIFSPGVPGI